LSIIISVLLALGWFADIHADEVKLTASDGAKENFFGYSADISGDYVFSVFSMPLW
jgi:hypothetical protein